MKLLQGNIGLLHEQISAVASSGRIATIGVFDGVHRGHAYLLSQLVDEARAAHKQSLVVTFRNHPRKVLFPEQDIPLLTTPEEKTALLGTFGIDLCVLVDFTEDFARQTSHDFMQNYLRDTLGIDTLLVGYDHRFGSNADGSFETYRKEGTQLGIRVVQADVLTTQSAAISSTAIRQLILSGRVADAAALLGHPYIVMGRVERGRGVGHLLGYPTANLAVSTKEKLLPACGAYAAKALVGTDTYDAMVYIGSRPTFNDTSALAVEAHILDETANFYGHTMTLQLVDFLRADTTFESADALRQQLARDVLHTKNILHEHA